MSSFSNSVIETINLISCPIEINNNSVSEFEKTISQWAELETKTHVLDFKKVTKLHKQFYDAVATFKKKVEAKQSKLISINMSAAIQEQVTQEGMINMFSHMQGFDGTDTPVERADAFDPEFKKKFMRYLVNSGRAAMYTMFQTTVTADENYVLRFEDMDYAAVFMSAVIVAQTRDFRAHLRLHFDKTCLEKLTRAFVRIPPGAIDPAVLASTATELMNLIYGAAKSNFNNDNNYDFPPVIPVVLPDEKAKSGRKSDGKNITILPFATPLGTFYLELEMNIL